MILGVLVLAASYSLPGVTAGATAPGLQATPNHGPPTTSTRLRGTGFGADEPVDLSFDSQLVRTVQADPTGSFRARVRVPASALPGAHRFRARGQSTGLRAGTSYTVRTDWHMFHYSPRHLGSNPYENVLSPSNVGGLTVAWTFTAPGFMDTSPAVVDGVVYAAGGKTFYAIDSRTGTELWSYSIRCCLFGDPAVVNGVVYVGADSGLVYALDAKTGQEIWTYATGAGIYGAVMVAHGVVYTGSVDTYVHAIRATDGIMLWRFKTLFDVTASPTLAGGVLYVGSNDNNLYALDAASGALLWSAAMGADIGFSTAAVANGLVYVGNDDHKLYAFRASGCGALTCEPVWTITTGSNVATSPAAVGGVVYFGSHDGFLYAVDGATGAIKWKVPGGSFALNSPVVANGVVYSGSLDDFKVNAFDAASGELLWSYTTGETINDTPAVADGVLYIGSFDHKLYAFHLPSEAG